MYAPFIAYLGEQMKLKIRFMVAQEYQELLNDLKRGIVHIAAFFRVFTPMRSMRESKAMQTMSPRRERRKLLLPGCDRRQTI
ncbi:MAG: hypothetical protein U1F27_01240 [Turneriella sp.]